MNFESRMILKLKWNLKFKLILISRSSFSEPCEEGTYRDSSMISCVECEVAEEPNTDKTTCGKFQYR